MERINTRGYYYFVLEFVSFRSWVGRSMSQHRNGQFLSLAGKTFDENSDRETEDSYVARMTGIGAR
jgi:hypothetical protein